MATAIQRRRGTTTQHNSFTGLAGEITIDTTKNTVVVHDGSTAGGIPLAKSSEVSALGGADITAVVAGNGLSGGSTSGDATINLDLNELSAAAVAVDADSIPIIDASDNSSKKESIADLVSGMAGTNLTASSGTLGMADTVIRGKISVTDAGGDGSLAYNNSTGVITYTGPSAAEVRAHISGGTGVTVSSGEISIGQAVATTSDVTFADLIVSGNLTVSGTQTTVNTETLTVDDNLIVLNNNESGTPSEDAGIEIERGTSTNVKLQFKESTDRWQFTNDGSTYFSLPTSTADIAENTNLYYTNARADARITAALIDEDNMASDSATRLPSQQSVKAYVDAQVATKDNTDEITEGSTNLYFTNARADARIANAIKDEDNMASDSATHVPSQQSVKAFVAAQIATKDNTDEMTEGSTNLYFTNARARSAISVSGDLAYNSSTGVISFTNDAGDIEGVTAGSGLSGGGSSGTVTVAVNHEAFSGNLIPSSNNTYQLGSASHVWKDVFVGPGSLYVNGQQVLSDNSGTIQVSADTNQNISILTTGTGDIELTSGGDIQLKTDVVISADKTITSSGGVKYASNINMNSNNINNVDNPVSAQDAATKAYVDAQVATKDNTDEITEGSSNLYFTNERAQDAVGSIIAGSGNVGVAYDDAAGTITISESLTTTDITEGDNQYFTNARAQSAITVTDAGGDGSLGYSGGTITYTGPSAAEVRAHLSAGSGMSYSGGAFAVDSTVVRTTGAQTVAGAKTFSNDAIFNGNLTVNGTQTIVNTETLTVDDNIIVLNNNASGTPSENAGFQVNRGSSSDVLLRWNEGSDIWEFTTDGSTYFTIAASTSDLAEGTNLYYTNARADARADARIAAADTDSLSEGSSNLYYTNARADARIAAADTGDLSEGSNLYYTNARADARVALATGSNLNLGSKDTDDLSEGSSNLYHTSARADARFDVKIAAADTDDLSEGSNNLYFTNARVDSRLTGGTGITYSSGTISVTAGSIGATQLSGSGVTAGVYGDADSVSQITVDTDGRITSAANVDIAISSGAVSGLAASATTDTTSASNISSGTLNSARLPDLAVADFGGAAIQTGSESFSDSDSVLMTAAAVQDKITSYGYTTTTGDITAVVAGNGLTGGASSGSATVAVGAGTYIIANADDIAVDATSANTASKVVARDGSGNFSAGTITATATNAQYADLAEIYKADGDIEPGSVVMFGGEHEITACDVEGHHAVAGVISTDPAHLMNAEAEGLPVALAGRVPCKVVGPVAKGDLMVSSAVSGHAKADNDAPAGRIIGKAIEAKDGEGEGVIEVLVNMM